MSLAARLVRGQAFRARVRLAGGTCGHRIELERGVLLRWSPHEGFVFGSAIYLGRGVVLDIPRGAQLTLEDNVKVMHYTVVAALKSVSIGAGTLIAEHCSIRDTNHGTSAELPVRLQLRASPTAIGREVWIGRSSAVLEGAIVGHGAIIGANSVVVGEIAANAVAVGCPATQVRVRS